MEHETHKHEITPSVVLWKTDDGHHVVLTGEGAGPRADHGEFEYEGGPFYVNGEWIDARIIYAD